MNFKNLKFFGLIDFKCLDINRDFKCFVFDKDCLGRYFLIEFELCRIY